MIAVSRELPGLAFCLVPKLYKALQKCEVFSPVMWQLQTRYVSSVTTVGTGIAGFADGSVRVPLSRQLSVCETSTGISHSGLRRGKASF